MDLGFLQSASIFLATSSPPHHPAHLARAEVSPEPLLDMNEIKYWGPNILQYTLLRNVLITIGAQNYWYKVISKERNYCIALDGTS